VIMMDEDKDTKILDPDGFEYYYRIGDDDGV
jgi:hypothetical protein